MAGVIAQLTANARKRCRENIIDSTKCVYILPHFHQYGFRPNFDNIFIVRRARHDIINQIELRDTKFIEEWHHEEQVCLVE